jgi:MFS family permease
MFSRLGLLHSYSGLERSVYVLFAARIINRMGDFVQLFLVLYLTTVIGLSSAEAGRFIMFTAVVNGAGILLGGWAADRFNRKYVLIGCQTAFGLSFAVSGFFTTTMAAPYIILISSIFRGATWPISNAMITDLTEGEERTKAFSLLYLGTNIGVAVGPLIAGLLFANHLPWIFWGDAVTTGLAVLAVLFWVRESKPSKQQLTESFHADTSGERAVIGNAVVQFLKRPILVAFLLFSTFSAFVYGQIAFSLPLQMSDLFAVDGARFYGYVMTVNAVTVLVLTAVVVQLSRKFRPAANLAMATVLFALGFGVLYILENLWLILLTTTIWTVGEILMVTYSNVFTAKHTPMSHRGRFYAIITFVQRSGDIVGPWFSGILVESLGIRYIWPVTAAVALVSSAGFWAMRNAIKKQELLKAKTEKAIQN